RSTAAQVRSAFHCFFGVARPGRPSVRGRLRVSAGGPRMELPARHEETFHARYPNLASLVPTAFEQLGWRVITTSPESWRVRVPMTWWSWGWRGWGEFFTVALAGGATVYV